jgi:hypothetical protein
MYVEQYCYTVITENLKRKHVRSNQIKSNQIVFTKWQIIINKKHKEFDIMLAIIHTDMHTYTTHTDETTPLN